MTTYTTRPHPWWPDTHIEILVDGEPHCGTPIGREQEMIAHLEATKYRHWGAVVEQVVAHAERQAIAAGHAYWIGDEDDYPKGFGGQRWRITFHDGREIVTTSLWHQGDIPADYRDRLPDNATLRAL